VQKMVSDSKFEFRYLSFFFGDKTSQSSQPYPVLSPLVARVTS
jgi:hypothetical protein